MSIRALLFDLDETLMVETASIQSALDEVCAGAPVPPDALKEAVLKRAKESWHAAPTGDYCRRVHISSWEGLHGNFAGPDPDLTLLRDWVPTYRREAWTQALADLGRHDPELGARLAEAFRQVRRNWHVKFADTDAVIARLRPRFRLGIVTNGASDIQREKIRAAGLESHFEAIVVSGDIGVGKPDSRPFRRALDLLELGVDDAVMIGNSLSRDIAGARAAGLRSIWVDREGQESTPDGCVRVTSLTDLIPVLEDWRPAT